MIFHYDFDLDFDFHYDFLEDNLTHDGASPYQVW